MVDITTMAIWFLVGAGLGALITGLSVAARLRGRLQGQLLSLSERAQRAETLADELRRQVEGDRAELVQVRQELSDSLQARAVAQTLVAEATRNVEEQKALLAQSRQELADTFQALSG